MKKIIAVFILSALLLMLTFSCSNTNGERFDLDLEENSNFGSDLGGLTFNFVMMQDYFMEGDSLLGFMGNTVFSDLAKQRIEDISTGLNVDFQIKYVNDAAQEALMAAQAGISTIDAIQDESFDLIYVIRAGALANLANLSPESLNYRDEAKWGTPDMLLSLMWNGGLYGVLPAAYPMLIYNSCGGLLVIDMNKVRTLGLGDPREFYENGTWTWDTFKQVLVDYTHKNNSGETVYGLLTADSWFIRSFVIANGQKFYEYDENKNSVTFGYFTDKGYEAQVAAQDILYGTYRENVSIVNPHDTPQEFYDGHGVMANLEAFQIYNTTNSVAYMLDDFAVLPFPTGPQAEPKLITSPYQSQDFSTCIPITAKDYDFSAIVIDALYEPFPGFETEESMLDYFATYYFTTIQDAEIFMACTRNATYNDNRDSIATISGAVSANSSVTAVLDSSKDRYATLIEQYILPTISSIPVLYGD